MSKSPLVVLLVASVSFAVLVGCDDDSTATLAVDLRTDFVGGSDFDGVRVLVGAGDPRPSYGHLFTPGGDYFRGQRVATHEANMLGETLVEVQLTRDGEVVVSRVVSVILEGGQNVSTVVITRNCEGVECPNTSGSPLFVSCLNGACADPRCTVETPEFCPDAECVTDSECTEPCSACVSGFCLTDSECSPQSDAGTFPDASVDAGANEPPAVETTCWQPEACDWTVPFRFNMDSSTLGREATFGANFTFSPDGCEVMFLRFVPPRDLYMARRTGPNANLESEMPIDGINGVDYTEDKATLSPTGLELFHTNLIPPDSGLNRAYRSTRAAGSDPWSARELVDELNLDGFNTYEINLAPHGLRVYLIHADDDTTRTLKVAERASLTDAFSAPTEIVLPSTAFSVASPSVTADGRVLTFISRAEPGSPREFHYATRPHWQAPWEEQTGMITSSFLDGGDEDEAIVSPDGCELFVRRDSSITRLVYRPL